jgi:hypothetical protein
MADYFFDTSALVKRHVSEAGSQQRQEAGFGPVTLVSADRDLNDAAIAEGLTLDDPNTHPSAPYLVSMVHDDNASTVFGGGLGQHSLRICG